MANNEHEHNFVPVVYTVQKQFGDYVASGSIHKGVIDLQHVVIFCQKCGESKDITYEGVINNARP